MKAHIGLDAVSELVHTLSGTSGRVVEVTQGNSPLHGQKTEAIGDADYQGDRQTPRRRDSVTRHIAMKLGKRKLLRKDKDADVPADAGEKFRAGIRPKVGNPLRVVKRQ